MSEQIRFGVVILILLSGFWFVTSCALILFIKRHRYDVALLMLFSLFLAAVELFELWYEVLQVIDH